MSEQGAGIAIRKIIESLHAQTVTKYSPCSLLPVTCYLLPAPSLLSLSSNPCYNKLNYRQNKKAVPPLLYSLFSEHGYFICAALLC